MMRFDTGEDIMGAFDLASARQSLGQEELMPLVIVKMLEGRTVEQKRGLVTAITEAVVEHTGAPADQVDVIIEDHPRTDWAKGGTLYSDK